MPGNDVSTWMSLSRHKAGKLCRALTLHCHARMPGSCAWPENHVATWKTTSRHRVSILCRDRDFFVATETRKWAVTHSGLLHLHFLFLFLPKHPKFRYKIAFLLQRQRRTWKTFQNTLIVQNEFNYNSNSLHIQKLGFYPEFYKNTSKAKSGLIPN